MTDPIRRLLLLRHAKAEHPQGVVDHQRPLALAGRRQSARVGAALAGSGLVPDLVLCSSSLRTRQTWELVRTNLASTLDGRSFDPVVELSDEVYAADVHDVIDLLRAIPEQVRTVLVVGHEPTMSHTAATLAGTGSDEGTLLRVRVGVPTASWTLLEHEDPWAQLAPNGARLLRLTTPD
ncbi:SixA phosphatase family protein [Cellulomonas soli]|uniref:Phosphoglycerate mutase n=1 Tax=Cellulomonas soli TaxID=931535 RepID=A0A512PH61_9CELL|nr:histidine phosphatase family protein [Cellulomonas soli]NYI60870.1 phosphohistidine phosphatase [Cellulomonas soli]GEP70546.1 phosphoglycerate mutase [Cellulomonas soli]